MTDVNESTFVEYGKSLFHTKELSRLARRAINSLPSDMDILLTTGSSGCSLASAMLVLSERTLYHLHKRASASDHGGAWVIPPIDLVGKHKVAIVDDFVCEGGTVLNLMADVEREFGYRVSTLVVGRMTFSQTEQSIHERLSMGLKNFDFDSTAQAAIIGHDVENLAIRLI